MAFRITDWRRNSTNWVRVYAEDTDTDTQPTDATVTCTLRRGGTLVFSGRAMTYAATVRVQKGFAMLGTYRCAVTVAESLKGSYSGTVTVTKSGNTTEEPFTATIA